MWNCCTLTSIMDLWLHDQISDMIHPEVIMADIVWPIFKWPLNDHGHGLAENNPELPGASNFWTFESICISGTVADIFLLYFVPGMKWLHAVAVGWMYLIGVMEVPQRRRYWTLSKRLTILKIYSVTTLSRLCQKGSQYVAIDWDLDTIGDFTP